MSNICENTSQNATSDFTIDGISRVQTSSPSDPQQRRLFSGIFHNSHSTGNSLSKWFLL